MFIYLVERISQHGWDDYDSFVCVAKSPRHARRLHPSDEAYKWNEEASAWEAPSGYRPPHNSGWVLPCETNVTLLGRAKRGQPLGIVCASFNAG